MICAPTLANFALKFGPPENFTLMLMGMTVVTYLARKSMLKALVMMGVGIFIGCIGLDPMTSGPRFTFGLSDLYDGVGLAPVIMGLFGISEVLGNVGVIVKADVFGGKIKGLFPNREDWKRSAMPITRGTLLGFFLGILPGVGNIVPQFISYVIEKKLSRHPEKFGTGMIEGVASPEACNNSAVGGTFIPLLSLGIPSNAMTAMLLGALMIYGVTPGPPFDQEHSRPLLGGGCEHVYRECLAPDSEPPSDSHLGEASQDSLLLPFLFYHSLLLDRRL